MQTLFKIFAILAIGVISCGMTFLIRQYAVRKNVMAIPNHRSLHDTPTPKGGGLAIVLSWYIGITLFFFLNMVEKNLYFALLCGSGLAVVSLIDDITGLRPYIRLIVQFVVALCAFYFLNGLRPLVLPGVNINYDYVIYPVAIVGMVWIINLFNFMDGVDGFASLEVIIVSTAMYFFTGNSLNLVLVACVAGFLFWNWPKARIFMGDVGSTQLGFILIVLGIYFHNAFKFSILNWIMLLSPFWFDATLTLYRRWRRGEKVSEAHKKHAYQRIVRSGFTHLQVNIWLFIINCFVILMILIYREFKFLQIPLFLLSLIFFYLITRIVDRRVPF